MATARTIYITPENTGLGRRKQSEAAARKVTELLQEDLEKHHCFFNKDGYHNHISHHLLTLYGMGASPDDIQRGYDDNAHYQRALHEAHSDKVEEPLVDFDQAKDKLGKRGYYTDFLVFFQNEIDKKGWRAVLKEYLFQSDGRSEDMLIRMFGGYLHPIAQLMFGIEWEQPAIVAMGLAQAAVHQDNARGFLLAAEGAAAGMPTPIPMPSLASLCRDVAADERLSAAARLSVGNRIRDGVLARAFDDMVRVAARVNVAPEELGPRTVEMYNMAICQAAAAALRPGKEKEPRFDFFLIHHVNVCPLFLTVNAQDWIPEAAKVRLLEWKIRLDLVQYAARACAPVSLSLAKIASYVPRDWTRKPTAGLLPRIYALRDDGHVAKLIRAIELCSAASQEYEYECKCKSSCADRLQIRGDALWTKVSQLVVDSAEGEGPNWLRGRKLPTDDRYDTWTQ
ncbi:HypA protein [Nemania serpens]|nr:HypA protein [Nemania serpens]